MSNPSNVSVYDRLCDAGLLQRALEDLVGQELSAGPNTIRCPLAGHEDKSASFSIDTDHGVWNCFSRCGGGGVVRLARLIRKLTIDSEAAAWLESTYLSADVPSERRQPARTETRRADPEFIAGLVTKATCTGSTPPSRGFGRASPMRRTRFCSAMTTRYSAPTSS